MGVIKTVWRHRQHAPIASLPLDPQLVCWLGSLGAGQAVGFSLPVLH